MTKNLAITVLTWNDWENTIKCLESIYQSTFSNFDVILVNNNSDKIHLDKIYEWSKNKINIVDEEINFKDFSTLNILDVLDPALKKVILILFLRILSLLNTLFIMLKLYFKIFFFDKKKLLK